MLCAVHMYIPLGTLNCCALTLFADADPGTDPPGHRSVRQAPTGGPVRLQPLRCRWKSKDFPRVSVSQNGVSLPESATDHSGGHQSHTGEGKKCSFLNFDRLLEHFFQMVAK